MFFDFVVFITLFLALFLFFYIFSIFLSIFITSFFSQKKIKHKDSLNCEVEILIPSHNEKQYVLETIDSLVRQNFSGKKKIILLLENNKDDTLNFLEKKYQKKSGIIEMKNNTFLHIVFCNVKKKSDRLNFYITSIKSPYVSLLDADHVAHPDFLLNGISMLEKNKSLSAVQQKRRPKEISSIFSIWDSLQNHIGNELINHTLSFFKKNVFLQGQQLFLEAGFLKKIFFQNVLLKILFFRINFLFQAEKSLMKIREDL